MADKGEEDNKIIQRRNYKRFNYTQKQLEDALQAVRSKNISANKASKMFGIPKGTLINKLHGKTIEGRKMGPATSLTTVEEDKLEEWIIGKAKVGFPMLPEEVKDAVYKLMIETERKNLFKDNRPGDKWMKLFLNRRPAISKRNTEIILKARARVTEQHIRDWFQELEGYLKEEDCADLLLDGSRIYNADETGVQCCSTTGKVLGPKKYRNFHEGTVVQEECITVLANVSADGKAVPPMVVFPYKGISRDITASIPSDYFIGRSESGWMVAATFFKYVANCFYPWLKKNGVKFPVLLLLDGHKSHVNMELHKFCLEKRILLFCLLPNATHIPQACDVGVFRAMKEEWRKSVHRYMQQSNQAITGLSFTPLFQEAFNASLKENTIKNAFKACGIYPFNVEAIDFTKCNEEPSSIPLRHETPNSDVNFCLFTTPKPGSSQCRPPESIWDKLMKEKMKNFNK